MNGRHLSATEAEEDIIVCTVQIDLLKEWDYEKNAKPPQEVTARSNKKCGGSAVHAVTSGRFLLTAGAA